MKKKVCKIISFLYDKFCCDGIVRSEVALDQFLSKTARDNQITASLLYEVVDDIIERRAQADQNIARDFGIETSDFVIAFLTKEVHF